MSIEPVKKLTLVAPAGDLDALQDRLYELRMLHLADAWQDGLEQGDPHFARPAANAVAAASRVQRLNDIEDVFGLCSPRTKAFIEGFSPTPVRISPEELQRHLDWGGLDGLHGRVVRLGEHLRSQRHRISEIEGRIEDLALYAELSFDVRQLRGLQRFGTVLGRMPAAQWKGLMRTAEAERLLMAEQLLPQGKQVIVVAAWLRQQGPEALELLRHHGFVEMHPPALASPPRTAIARLRTEADSLRQAEAETERTIVELAEEHRDRVNVLLGYWESQEAKLLARNRMAVSRRMAVVRAFVRTADLPALRSTLAREFPTVALHAEDPDPGDNVPVSLRTHPLIQPGGLLINMFGLPDYFTFDPTPFITAVFVVFFGICFGDTVYGLALVAFCAWMMRRYRPYPALRGFFHLFLYCGIATATVGFFTGTWLGDIYEPKYLGPGNPLLQLRQWQQAHGLIIDPLQSPLTGLMFVLGIGVMNQLYGITLKMYGAWRRRRWAEALFDGGLWWLVLPGMLILISKLFGNPPAWLVRFGTWMFIVGVAGLVLTQGRAEEGIVAKAITGLVSVYGILGSYGCAQFVGDMLSYSRLLALALTTTVVAIAFNLIAGLVKGVPAAGIALFVLVLIAGHTFNFVISMLGGFVHSARLLFLEMFTRFYEPGGTRFEPLGFSSQRVMIE
jgi:V/A-type H+-transporting ATPase subunit I